MPPADAGRPAAAVDLVELGEFLTRCAGEVNSFLDRALPPASGPGATLGSAMRYAVLGGGKRIRPALAMASAITVGGRARDALHVAGALEMVHTYSLIHDDLPCMDDDDLRRGQPTVHVRYGEAVAVLAGDALHTLAFSTIGDGAGPPEMRLGCVERLAAAAGQAGMVGGQVLDMEAETQAPDARGLEAIHRGKTGALIAASVALGALAGGGTAGQADALAAFGRELGLVFQIVDDLLDEQQTSSTLGKSAGKDRAAGKATYPAVHGIAGARAEAVRRAETARRLLDEVGRAPGPPVNSTGMGLLHALTERILHRSA
jgi:farnesyl diphosphate synthase